MRAHFSDTARLKKLAEKNLKTGVLRWTDWWCKKYKLPPNHPLLLNRSVAELELEFYEDLQIERDRILEQIHDEDSNLDTKQRDEIYVRLNRINEILGYPVEVQDDLIDKWERELAAGQIPDLNEVPNA